MANVHAFGSEIFSQYTDLPSLELTAKNHNASSIAQLLLLKEYQRKGDERYEKLLQKTALYIDPLWLQYVLTPEPIIEIDASPVQNLIETEIDSNDDETHVENVSSADFITQDAEKEEWNEGEVKETNTVSQTDEIESESTDIKEEIEIVNSASDSNNKATVPSSIANESTEIHSTEEFVNKKEEIEKQEMGEKLPTLLKNVKETSVTNEDSLFEPLHAVDYFASQGIIIRDEDLKKDKLGAQMKSFSEWLKSMKQLHPNKLPQQNEVVEKLIQSSAEQSNRESDILTEAMAEVLVKQNKQDKAIEMYEKLSLMNPSKSSYFAAKIERIKNN